MSKAVYAGTFDPMTYGHLDVAARAAHVFEHLTLAVAEDPRKTLLFSIEERLALARSSVAGLENVEVVPFSGLLVNWARQQGIHTLIRGLRAFSDFEYEFQMALTNRKLAPDIETMFLMPNEDFSYVSSSMVREIAALGGDVDQFVPSPVAAALKKKLAPQ
ncbi:MAG TPA: pantetheine-phosphate adenylyltransferase [Verrucomicrobia bacterium]|nr:pantetheine-phosphate adenylyltransferase [Verrucomicrobiota bacterium]